ncbi:hypothetical protein [Sinorhizobium meliloti]|uniref:hypothetical protein n=1 Tax=Rhizobium meliloti TaxID=382 RepID=UPI0001E4B02D|nr:hypothetical protein [Sinorhizobium meliloti]MDE4591113.1 hypothetical protein [Sinorhizobium meliloti]SEI56496.1 hypothetical protein SAMN04244575_01075 [Sinorhizobium meliloti]
MSDWHEYKGDRSKMALQPTASDLVEVVFRDGTVIQGLRDDLVWRWADVNDLCDDPSFDIIRYRIKDG